MNLNEFDLKLADKYEKLVNSEYLADVIFHVGINEEIMHGHKNIISLSSEVFFAMFNGDFDEGLNNKKPIPIPDIEPAIFLELLRFMYCEKANINSQNIIALYYGSQKYLLKNLNCLCEDFFRKQINEENVLKIFNDNRKQEFSVVNQICLGIISDNPLVCFQHPDFYTLDMCSLYMILSYEVMNCSKAHLKEALNRWSEIQGENYQEAEYSKLKNEFVDQERLAYNCRKLMFYGPFRYDPNVSLSIRFTPQRNMSLYGLGIFVGTDSKVRNQTMVHFEITLQSESLEHPLDKIIDVVVDLKEDMYTHDFFFEKTRLSCLASYKLIVKNNDGQSNFMMFCLTEFKPIVDDKITVQKIHNYVQGNIISHFLYNVDEENGPVVPSTTSNVRNRRRRSKSSPRENW